jgi:hypothetical protein
MPLALSFLLKTHSTYHTATLAYSKQLERKLCQCQQMIVSHSVGGEQCQIYGYQRVVKEQERGMQEIDVLGMEFRSNSEKPFNSIER